MNEQRQQAYLNLIRTLLNCSTKSEILGILAVNQDLQDAGFLKTVEMLKMMSSQRGDTNTVSMLQDLSNYLREELAKYLRAVLRMDNNLDLPSLKEEEKESYFQFFKKALQATAENMGNPQAIYPLLADNLDKLDANLAGILLQWGTKVLKDATTKAEYIAATIVIFSTSVAQFPLRNKADNIEITIAGCEVALIVYTRHAFPYDWAMAKMNLANAYNIRIKGNRANNLEQAITYYQESLEIYKFETFSQPWAMVKMNLANACSDRIKGNKADNLEQAISYYLESLKVYKPESFPKPWAMVKDNLASAYTKRIKGTKADNIERAISYYREALSIFTLDSFPLEYAQTKSNLGTAYGDRIRGTKVDNIELAISCYGEAIQIYTPDDFPYEWARTKHNLANAYTKRIKGIKADNIEQAITYFLDTLTVRTFEIYPQDWAATQHSLANAYCDRIREDKAENLENGITCFHNALKVYTSDNFPYEWAMIQNNLATAYIERIKGVKAENLEQAIACCNEALKVYTLGDLPQNWAMSMINFATAYLFRIKENKGNNLEQSIHYYQEALKVYTVEHFPSEWANAQHNLGNAYRERIKGNKGNNLEQSINYYQEALKVHTVEHFPFEWARAQFNLASAFGYRIKGIKAENLEQAIICCQESLKVYTDKAFPFEWANTLNSLATIYRNRIRSDKAENLELAISYLLKSQKVYTYDALPENWATTQTNLANIYGERILGDKAENLEQAISYYKEALQVYTWEKFPQDWAKVQNNLAIIYCKRIRGDKAENLEQAIFYCRESLKVYTWEDFPYEWGRTKMNLSNAYVQKATGNLEENLEEAIFNLKESLKVYTYEDFPFEWARTKNNLGLAYNMRIHGDEAANLEQAISNLKESLKVYTYEDFPQYWANIQFSLGLAFTSRVNEESIDNLDQAISCFQKTLKIRTFETLPQKYAESLWGQGIAYQKLNQFTSAYNTYASAIATVESLREEIISGEESKRKQAEYFNEIYSRMVEVCLQLGNTKEAIEYVERSKTRNLVELIFEEDYKSIFPPHIVTKLEEYRDKIASGQYQIQNGIAENSKVLAKHLQELRKERSVLQDSYLAVGDSFSLDSFQNALDEHTVVIEWYLLKKKIIAFVITSEGELNIWQSKLENREALEKWRIQYLYIYKNHKDRWQKNLGIELEKLASILHIDELLTLIPSQYNKLILIPHQILHLFPLHALPVKPQESDDSYCLLDLFTNGVSYAPSCQLLQQLQTRQRPNFESLLAIQNPAENLYFADLEVENLLSYFPNHKLLSQKKATKAALSEAITQIEEVNYIHFSCHGFFNFKSPQNSYLELAEADVSKHSVNKNPENYLQVSKDKTVDLTKCLMLSNLFERNFDLSKTRLVVLSACETAFIDSENTSDEYIGLPSGFLYAGCSSVVSSLWTVNDLYTSFLMIKFIQNLQNNKEISMPVAMNQAQLWLRDVNKEDLQKWAIDLPLKGAIKMKIRRKIHNMSGEKPLNYPYYWAAFTAVGK